MARPDFNLVRVRGQFVRLIRPFFVRNRPLGKVAVLGKVGTIANGGLQLYRALE